MTDAVRSRQLRVRAATAADLDAIARIWHVGWADGHVGHVPDGLLAHRHAAQFAERAARHVDTTSVATMDDEVVGFVLVVDDEVEQIYVDRAARGSGAATALLRTAEEQIRHAGHRQAWLAVVAGNARARAFYERAGWRDALAFDYEAETESGPLIVPSHRYEVDLEG